MRVYIYNIEQLQIQTRIEREGDCVKFNPIYGSLCLNSSYKITLTLKKQKVLQRIYILLFNSSFEGALNSENDQSNQATNRCCNLLSHS